jgi:rfaE bifunctional protein nucleotidyltransferase chain/domain/rfaE bifunctional protein kinase chain/domain
MTPAPSIVILGDSLLDRTVTGSIDRLTPEGCPVVEPGADVERPGGAALAAAAVAAEGAAAILVTAIGDDDRGQRLRALLWEIGVRVIDLGLEGPTPQKCRIRAGDRTVLRVDEGCRPVGAIRGWAAAASRALVRADAVLVADYGRGLAGTAPARAALEEVGPRVPVVWDPHPHGDAPTASIDVLTPNVAEAARLSGQEVRALAGLDDVLASACRLADDHGYAVALTMGERGAVLAEPARPPLVFPTHPQLGDTCGAGDRFAAQLTCERGRGADRAAAVASAVRAAASFVATGSLASAPSRVTGAVEVAERVRRSGGRLVVAGGCFDLLHAGHVALLEAARGLGDCLIVCMNSDRSVRELKGPGRPLVGQEDRRRVLEALGCVDAVHVFDEVTPCEALRSLRPQLFAKGGDYNESHLPERDVIAAWGGQVVLLPFLDGHSSSGLIELARAS